MIEIEHNLKLVDKALDEMQGKLEDEISELVTEVSKILAQQSIENVREQGAKFGTKWKSPSKWIQAKKGYGYRLFDRQETRIRAYGVSRMVANVAFFSPGEWTLTQHEKGFTIPASGDDVTLTGLKSPSALGLPAGKTSLKFNWKNDSVVPRRKMWPSQSQAVQIATVEVSKWVTLTSNRKLI